jgi:hypothetical protein
VDKLESWVSKISLSKDKKHLAVSSLKQTKVFELGKETKLKWVSYNFGLTLNEADFSGATSLSSDNLRLIG